MKLQNYLLITIIIIIIIILNRKYGENTWVFWDFFTPWLQFNRKF
jgi:hypothetical protein